MLNGATLRIGNAEATGLLNGTPLGPIVLAQVREVVFKNGSYKIVTTD